MRGVKQKNGLIWWPAPCPALDKSKQKNKCRIYNIRPFVCRQFLCGKESKNDRRQFNQDGSYNLKYFKNLLKTDPEFKKIKDKTEEEAIKTWGKKYNYRFLKPTKE